MTEKTTEQIQRAVAGLDEMVVSPPPSIKARTDVRCALAAAVVFGRWVLGFPQLEIDEQLANVIEDCSNDPSTVPTPTVEAKKVMDLVSLRILLEGANPLGPLVVTSGTIQTLIAEYDRVCVLIDKLERDRADVRIENEALSRELDKLQIQVRSIAQDYSALQHYRRLDAAGKVSHD
jgi:hypothetical protein